MRWVLVFTDLTEEVLFDCPDGELGFASVACLHPRTEGKTTHDLVLLHSATDEL